jgi:vacuolar-type H+-ATPase subunit C/Vma6
MLSESTLADQEGVRQAFQTMAPDRFTAALDTYVATGNTTELDARIDDYFISQAKSASADLFSSASLVLYYLRVRQSAANIRTVVVGRNSGMDEVTIRANIRTAYVNN